MSRQSCVLCALTVRDFLVRIGFNARVRPVCVVLWAEKNGELVHSTAIGAPHNKCKLDRRWNGHLIVTAADWLIDPTLYQVKRPAWPDLPGMMAVPIYPRPWKCGWWRLEIMAGVEGAEDDFSIGWLDNPKNKGWQFGPDGYDPKRRAPVIGAMIERFGTWEEDARDWAVSAELSRPKARGGSRS